MDIKKNIRQLSENSATQPIGERDLMQFAKSFANTDVLTLDIVSRKIRFEMCRRLVMENVKNGTILYPEIGLEQGPLIELLSLAEYRTLGLTPIGGARSTEQITRLQREISAILSQCGMESAAEVAMAYSSLADGAALLLPEVGYTPANLNTLLQETRCTRQQCAALLGVSLRSVQNWCTELDSPGHADMPTKKWVQLYQLLRRTGIPNDRTPTT